MVNEYFFPLFFSASGQKLEATLSSEERVSWIWAIFFCFLVPEYLMLFRCIRICIFRRVQYPKLIEFLVFAVFETLHIIGIALLVLFVLPNMEVSFVILFQGLCNPFPRFKYFDDF